MMTVTYLFHVVFMLSLALDISFFFAPEGPRYLRSGVFEPRRRASAGSDKLHPKYFGVQLGLVMV